MNRLADNAIAIVVLAAGRGQRMGAQPKLLLPLDDGEPMIRHVAHDALALGPSEVLVVVRPDLPEIAGALGGLPVRCVPNPRYEQGMGTSLAAGIEVLQSDVEAAMVLLGDMPYVAEDIIGKLVSAYLSERKLMTM